jgi:hypothetical protein
MLLGLPSHLPLRERIILDKSEILYVYRAPKLLHDLNAASRLRPPLNLILIKILGKRFGRQVRLKAGLGIGFRGCPD